jgi:hypothetical protein
VIWPDAAETTVTINGSNNAAHLSLDGAGIPPMTRNFMAFGQDDGGIDKGVRIEERRMVWKLLIEATTESSFDSKRDALWSIFRPLDDPLRLRVTKANGDVRQIDFFVDGPIEVATGPGYLGIVTVPLVAPDPLWYEPTLRSGTMATWPSTAFLATMPYGAYGATWHEWPVVKITGPVTDLEITNELATGIYLGHIDFRGHSIPAGATYTVDLRPGKKTVVDHLGANKLTALSSFHRLQYFRFYAEPQKVGGVNTLTIRHAGVGAGAQIVFERYSRYIAL